MNAFGNTLTITPKFAREVLARPRPDRMKGGFTMKPHEHVLVEAAWRKTSFSTVGEFLKDLAKK